MEKQKSAFLKIVSDLKCPKHNEPIVLVCIQKDCQQNERTFCFECNDEAHSNKNSHILISIKKFDSMYDQYGHILKSQSAQKQAKQSLMRLKENFLSSLKQIEQILQSNMDDDFAEGEQEQIMKGKLNNLLKNKIWNQVIEMKNKKIIEDQISVQINKENLRKKKIAIEGILNLQKTLELETESLKTILLTNNEKQSQPRYFSSQRKHVNLKLSKDRKAVSNLSQYGHYYCLSEKDFDIYNPLYRFNIGKIDKDTSYWFGFVFPTLCENRKWTNIYDQGMGGFFIVLFQNGNKINLWNHEKGGFKSSQELNAPVVTSYSTLELSINFQTKQLTFNLNSQGKKTLLKTIKPQKWFGKIYPAVGFYGNGGTITLQ